MEVLYQADMKAVPAARILDELQASGAPVARFTRALVDGVEERRAEIDAVIADAAEEWSIDRLAAIDRGVLRVACYELRHRADVPVAVVISEAVEAVNELSTAESGRFVNGILARVARETPVEGRGSPGEDSPGTGAPTVGDRAGVEAGPESSD